jgi:hypothetical protein
VRAPLSFRTSFILGILSINCPFGAEKGQSNNDASDAKPLVVEG